MNQQEVWPKVSCSCSVVSNGKKRSQLSERSEQNPLQRSGESAVKSAATLCSAMSICLLFTTLSHQGCQGCIIEFHAAECTCIVHLIESSAEFSATYRRQMKLIACSYDWSSAVLMFAFTSCQ